MSDLPAQSPEEQEEESDGDLDSRLPIDDQPMPVHDLGKGRGWVLLGATLLLVAFFLPVATAGLDQHTFALRGLSATSRARTLWLLPTSALLIIAIVAWRRTPRAMRSVRLAVPLLGLLAAGTMGYVVFGVHEFANAHSLAFSVGEGCYLAFAAAALCIAFGLRLGVKSRDVTRRPRRARWS